MIKEFLQDNFSYLGKLQTMHPEMVLVDILEYARLGSSDQSCTITSNNLAPLIKEDAEKISRK
ncbi:hypothetical protein HYT25_02985 [Candidatus Pacearchaeota archaeon]|nr:hypothetical protein [Candidatus Pacearchaeota archaeon]